MCVFPDIYLMCLIEIFIRHGSVFPGNRDSRVVAGNSRINKYETDLKIRDYGFVTPEIRDSRIPRNFPVFKTELLLRDYFAHEFRGIFPFSKRSCYNVIGTLTTPIFIGPYY